MLSNLFLILFDYFTATLQPNQKGKRGQQCIIYIATKILPEFFSIVSLFHQLRVYRLFILVLNSVLITLL